MYFKRKAEQKIKEHIESQNSKKDVLLVSGARQVGKSTMLEKLLEPLPNVLSINLQEQESFIEKIDRTKDFKEFEQLLKFELEFNPKNSVLYIDEAQNSKRLGSYVRFIKEKWTNCTAILSGSMMSDLFKDKYPVGRVQELVLRPFTFEEFLDAQNKKNLLEFLNEYQLGGVISQTIHSVLLDELQAYFTIGGLPEVILKYINNENWSEQLQNVLFAFRKDFALRYGSDKAAQMWETFKAVSKYLGSPSKYTQIIDSNAPGYKAVPKMLSQLEYWHLVLHAEQNGNQPESKLHPKRYMFDIGAAQKFRYSSRPLPLLHDKIKPDIKQALGGLVENFVAIQLSFISDYICGYKEKSYEMDFIYTHSGNTIPLEVKASQKNKKSQFSSIIKYCDTYKLNRGICLNLATPTSRKTKNGLNLYSLPLYLIEQLSRLLKT